MIAYIRGIVSEIHETKTVVEVQGIGYQIFITSRDAQRLPSVGEETLLYTYFHVKEDAMQLFGFLAKDDREVFRLLLNVNGIGPKAALGVLSAMSADELRFAVLADDAKSIAKAPGIGIKTAQKMILELKDKLKLEDVFERFSENQTEQTDALAMNDAKSEAVQALTALGYSNAEALKAVRRAGITDDMSTEELLKAALKNMF